MLETMLETARFYTNHTIIGIVTEGIPGLCRSIRDVVHEIAIPVIVQVAITIPLFYLHHNLFALGFIIGFVFDKEVKIVVEKVNIVYNTQRSMLENALLFGGGGLIACLAMPTSMIIATLYYSAQWGALLYQNSFARYEQQNAIDAEPNLVPAEQAIEVVVV